jgi:hypothetical protein
MILKMIKLHQLSLLLLVFSAAESGCTVQSRSFPRYQISNGENGCYVLDNDTGILTSYNNNGLVSSYNLNDFKPRGSDRFYTSLSCRDAVSRALNAVHEKFGIPVFNMRPDNTVQNADRFSAWGSVSTAANKSLNIECEWVSDGKTEVTLESDLPPAQMAAMTKIIRDALDAQPSP